MKNYLYLTAIVCVSLVGCSSSSSTTDNTEGTTDSEGSTPDTVLTGVFLDSAVEGLSYATATLSGITNASGEFQYVNGESITFSIGDLSFPAVTAKATVTPLDMTESNDINENLVVNSTVLLQSLDVDANPDNGITLSEQAAANATAINLNVDPSEFAQNVAVINLVANSGSTNTSVISTEKATQHFQLTLVDTGELQSLTRLEYTNLMIGNTVEFSAGSSIYYREDGAKFSRRSGGEEFQGTWWLDNEGLICEQIRGGESDYCIADAENYLFTKSTESDSYNYSETGFVSSVTISAGDTLALSGDGTSQYVQITSESISELFDKSLFLFNGEELEDDFIIVRNDGTFDGTWNEAPIAGSWEMRDNFFCRVLTVFFDQSRTGTEDCQLWEIKDDSVRGTRDMGNGSSFIYKIR